MDKQQQQNQRQQMKARRQRTVYSPVERRLAASERGLPRLDRPKPLDPSTSAKLRYLDDGGEEEEDDDNDKEDQDLQGLDSSAATATRVMFEKCQANKTSNQNNSKQTRNSSRKLQHMSDALEGPIDHKQEPGHDLGGQHSSLDDYEADRETTASLEEVYLCSCCGVTRPLEPAMEFMSVFRGSFLLFNFLVFAFNFANLALGLWFRIDPKVYEIHKYISTQNFTYAGYLLLAGGLLGCLAALAGFAAANSASRAVAGANPSGLNAKRRPAGICLLISYALTMTLLTVAFIGALVLLTVYGLGAPLERFMDKEIFEQMRRRTMASPESGLVLPNQNDATQFLDFVQVKLRCCGAQSWRDYNKLGLNVPTTCYTFPGNMVGAPGCGRALRELFDIRAGLAAATTAASVLVQLLATVLASLMVCSIYNYRASPRPASAASYVSASRARPGLVRQDSPFQLSV